MKTYDELRKDCEEFVNAVNDIFEQHTDEDIKDSDKLSVNQIIKTDKIDGLLNISCDSNIMDILEDMEVYQTLEDDIKEDIKNLREGLHLPFYDRVQFFNNLYPVIAADEDCVAFYEDNILFKHTKHGWNIVKVRRKTSNEDELTVRGGLIATQITETSSGQLSGKTRVNPIYGDNLQELTALTINCGFNSSSELIKHKVFEDVVSRKSNKTSRKQRTKQELAEQYGFDSVEDMETALSDN